MKGTVKWYDPKKGFGFIHVEGERDIFIHKSDMSSGLDIQTGDTVEFEVEETMKGLNAVNIEKL